MRAREIIVEADLSHVSTPSNWLIYLNNLVNSNNISIGKSGEIKQNLTLSDNSKTLVSNLRTELENALSNNTTVHPNYVISKIKSSILNFTDGSQYKLNQVFKSTDVKGKQLETRSFGTAAEGLLGAAMFAKLTARGGDLVADINADDIWRVIDSTKENPIFATEVNDINNLIADRIELESDLTEDIKKLLFEPSLRTRFAPYVSSFVSYANSTLAETYANMLYKNNRFDNIKIKLEGKKGGKIDVLINVLDEKGQATRKLEQVKYSVKLAKAFIGQVGRGRNEQEVYNNLQKLFGPLGVDLSSKQNSIIKRASDDGIDFQFAGGIIVGYKEAAKQMALLAKSADTTSENAQFISKLSYFINKHSSENDPSIQTIEVDKNDVFRILNYNQLFREIKKNNIDVGVDYNEGFSEKYATELPEIIFYDRNRGLAEGKLLKIRFRFRGGYANHAIEPFPLLKDLATYRRYKK